MPRETMTGRERWLAVLRRETPDRIPMDYWATPETSAALCRNLKCESLDDAMRILHADPLLRLSPAYVGPPLPEGMDMYGVEHKPVVYSTGVYLEPATHPLAAFESAEEIEDKVAWPSADWFDFGGVGEVAAKNPHRMILGGAFEPFLTYCQMRGLEQAFADLICEPEIVRLCLGRILEFDYECTTRLYEAAGAGNVQVSYVSEDMGSQTGLMFAPDQVREFLLPGMKRMIDLAHQAGAYVFHHNDGAIRDIIPTMIDAGIDALNPIQWRCAGMGREGLKRDFGDRVVFHGAVDNQETLPFGTADDVRREVLENLRILGAGGGYILAPCHNIQSVTPHENIVALYETGYEYGWQ